VWIDYVVKDVGRFFFLVLVFCIGLGHRMIMFSKKLKLLKSNSASPYILQETTTKKEENIKMICYIAPLFNSIPPSISLHPIHPSLPLTTKK
jgi:hypothetical protein